MVTTVGIRLLCAPVILYQLRSAAKLSVCIQAVLALSYQFLVLTAPEVISKVTVTGFSMWYTAFYILMMIYGF